MPRTIGATSTWTRPSPRPATTAGGVRFTREVFSSPVDQVIVVRLTADKPGKVTFTAGMKTPQKASVGRKSRPTLW